MKKKILVVDDEFTIRELLKFKLSLQGFEVVTAKNGEEFEKSALTQKPDLIILDIWLKNKIGTDVYHHLLDTGFDPEVPVVFITALIENQPAHPYTSGGKKYALYGKPFNFDELLKDINRLVCA